MRIKKTKLFLAVTASVCMAVFSGCMSISEQQAPKLREKFSIDVQLHLEGFKLYSVREKQYREGSSVFTGYNFKNDSWLVR